MCRSLGVPEASVLFSDGPNLLAWGEKSHMHRELAFIWKPLHELPLFRSMASSRISVFQHPDFVAARIASGKLHLKRC
jgi:hypothetical protein